MFCREGVLVKLKPNGKKQIRRVFLFNDMLLYCREKSSTTLIYRGCIKLHAAMLRNHPTLPFTFQIRMVEKENKLYTFLCKNEFEIQEWTKDLKKLMEEESMKLDPSSKKTKKLIEANWQLEL